MLKAARALGIPVAAAIMSWDHLSSKALLHVAPDQVLVWNEVQKREAVEMHGLPADRVVATGAQCYDQWFTRTPERSREEFCRGDGAARRSAVRAVGALGAEPDARAARAGARDAVDRGAARAAPTRGCASWACWCGRTRSGSRSGPASSLDALRERRVPRPQPDRRATPSDDYFDSLYYSSAVVGLVTSAFLEAAIVGRPVLTFTLPEYRMHQEEMIHFRYLLTVEGGLLHTAPDLDDAPRAARRGGGARRRARRAEPPLPRRVRPARRPRRAGDAGVRRRARSAGTAAARSPIRRSARGAWLRPAGGGGGVVVAHRRWAGG